MAETDPAYVGYHRRTDVYPLISYRAGSFFFSGFSVGYVLEHRNSFTLSLMVLPQLMRLSASQSPQFAGLQSREWTINGGLSFSWKQSWGVLAGGGFQDILDRNNGTELRLQYAYPLTLGKGQLSPGIGLAWMSANLTNYYYGVSQAESLANRPAYSPGTAFNPSLRLDYTLPFGSTWRLNTGVSYARFDRSIRDSPLIDQSQTSAVYVSFVRKFIQH